jgi:hypothetical protein
VAKKHALNLYTGEPAQLVGQSIDLLVTAHRLDEDERAR